MTGTLTDTAKDLREQATGRIAETVETMRPHMAAALVSAKDSIEQLFEELEEFVEETAWPALTEAGEQAREKALPVVASGAARAEEWASHAKEVVAEKADEVTGKKKRRRRKQLVAVLGLTALAATAGIIARKALGGGDDTWHAPAGPPITPVTTDEAAEEPNARPVHGDPLTDPLE